MTRVAFPTDDGKTISRHMGQAQYFQVIDLENGQPGQSELRSKASHQHGDHTHAQGDAHPGAQMIETIRDCQVLIAGGMGEPMFQRAQNAGLQVYLTGEPSISAALQAYAAGTLDNDARRVHAH